MNELGVLLRGPAAQIVPVLEAAGDRARWLRYTTQWPRRRDRLERQAVSNLVTLFEELGRYMARVATQHNFKPVDPDLKEEAETSRDIAEVNRMIRAADLPKWSERRMRPWLEKLYESAWAGSWSLAQLEGTPQTKVDAGKQKVLREGGKRLGLIDLTENAKSSLFRVMEFSRNYQTGQASPYQVAKWIQNEVPPGRFVNAGSRYRAQLIARTEIMHASRVSTIETFKLDSGVERLVAIDGDYDEDCAARNGTEFTLADAEAELASETVHPNCTLAFMPALVRP